MSAVSLITSAVSAAAPTGSVAATSSLVTVPLGFGARPTDAPAAPVDGTLGPALSPEQLAEDVGYQVLWAVGMNFVLSSLFFAGRVTSRWMTRVKPRPSDWILLAGILASFGVGGCYIWSVKAGAGRHFLALANENRAAAEAGTSYKAFFCAAVTYFAAISLIKLSILALFYELFGTLHYRIAIWVLTGIVLAWWVSFTILNFVLCTPLWDIWDLSPANNHNCIDGPHYMINGISNVVTDILILCLPIRIVWGMLLPVRAKIGLSLIFLLGSFVCFASAFRLGYTLAVRNLDPSFDLVVTELWSMIELIVAIASACLMTMRPLLTRGIPAFVSSALSRRSRSRSRPVDGASQPPTRGLTGRRGSEKAPFGARRPSAAVDAGTAPAGYPGSPHCVRTKITARRDPYAMYEEGGDATAGEEDEDDEKGTRIHVTQSLPMVSIEPRARAGSFGDRSSAEDLEAGRREGGSASTSTKELWPLR